MHCRIPVSDLRPGMFVVSVDGSWLNSPFWRTRFLLKDGADIARLHAAGIEVVTIDDARGIGLTVPDADASHPAVDGGERPLVVERRARRRPRHPASEIERARDTDERAKVAVTRLFSDVRLGRAVQIEDVGPLVDEIAASIERDRAAILNVTRLKTKNEYTYLHSVAVCALMINLARQLGLPEREVQQAGFAGLLHDIGKMATPQAVLDKPGGLDPDERRIIEQHPQAGFDLLQGSAGVSAMALDVCLHHHERIDGRGYPFGLSGAQLSLHARMGAICDVYDAVTSERPYKNAWSPAEALARMLGWQGHFDATLMRAFIASIGIFPLGGLVRLHSNRLGVVMRSTAAEPSSPLVRVFFQVAPPAFAAIEDVATHNAAGGDPIIRGEQGEQWFGDAWPDLRAKIQGGADGRELAPYFPSWIGDAARGQSAA